MKKIIKLGVLFTLISTLMLAFNQEVRAENNPVKDQSIFKSGDTTQANYFRIPCIVYVK